MISPPAVPLGQYNEGADLGKSLRLGIVGDEVYWAKHVHCVVQSSQTCEPRGRVSETVPSAVSM